jgi:hypothetical protein
MSNTGTSRGVRVIFYFTLSTGSKLSLLLKLQYYEMLRFISKTVAPEAKKKNWILQFSDCTVFVLLLASVFMILGKFFIITALQICRESRLERVTYLGLCTRNTATAQPGQVNLALGVLTELE